jgi:hypothetical protein
MSDIPDDYMSENPIELSETQKFGKGMRIYGFIRLGSILATFIISLIASSLALQNVDTSIEDFDILEEMLLQEMNEILNSLWILTINYIIEVIIVIGLIIFLVQMVEFKKIYEGERDIIRSYYLFLISLVASCIAIITSFVSLFIPDSFENLLFTLDIIGAIFVLGSHGVAIGAYFLLKNWGVMYERQMGSQLPILSMRFRRMFIGEILIISGNLAVFLVDFLSILIIFGEIFIGINLIRAGKLLMLDTFPQTPSGMGYMGNRFQPSQPARAKQHYPEEYNYQQPQKLIPDKAYFCPSCGAQLVSESQDFCMKCGKPIPKPDTSEVDQDQVDIESKTEPKGWKCKFCGSENPSESTICENCGENGRPE